MQVDSHAPLNCLAQIETINKHQQRHEIHLKTCSINFQNVTRTYSLNRLGKKTMASACQLVQSFPCAEVEQGCKVHCSFNSLLFGWLLLIGLLSQHTIYRIREVNRIRWINWALKGTKTPKTTCHDLKAKGYLRNLNNIQRKTYYTAWFPWEYFTASKCRSRMQKCFTWVVHAFMFNEWRWWSGTWDQIVLKCLLISTNKIGSKNKGTIEQ